MSGTFRDASSAAIFKHSLMLAVNLSLPDFNRDMLILSIIPIYTPIHTYTHRQTQTNIDTNSHNINNNIDNQYAETNTHSNILQSPLHLRVREQALPLGYKICTTLSILAENFGFTSKNDVFKHINKYLNASLSSPSLFISHLQHNLSIIDPVTQTSQLYSTNIYSNIRVSHVYTVSPVLIVYTFTSAPSMSMAPSISLSPTMLTSTMYVCIHIF
jgi:hypothetical protein